MEKSRKREKQKESNLIQALTIVGSEEPPVWFIKGRKKHYLYQLTLGYWRARTQIFSLFMKIVLRTTLKLNFYCNYVIIMHMVSV